MPPTPQEQLDVYIEQVKVRAATDPAFVARLAPFTSLLIATAPSPGALTYDIGTAGLALHIDDVESGRWTP